MRDAGAGLWAVDAQRGCAQGGGGASERAALQSGGPWGSGSERAAPGQWAALIDHSPLLQLHHHRDAPPPPVPVSLGAAPAHPRACAAAQSACALLRRSASPPPPCLRRTAGGGAVLVSPDACMASHGRGPASAPKGGGPPTPSARARLFTAPPPPPGRFLHGLPPPRQLRPSCQQTACNYAQDKLGYVGQQKQVAKTTHTKHTDTNKEPP